jgi:hypothetical protein
MSKTIDLEINHTLELFSENTDEGATIDVLVKFFAEHEIDNAYGADADGNRGIRAEFLDVTITDILIDVSEMRRDSTFYLKNPDKAKLDGKDITDFVYAYFKKDYEQIKTKCEECASMYFEEAIQEEKEMRAEMRSGGNIEEY